ncbi:MAG TPA: response regulator [Ohtaekwangia sp.]|nr:response regulator [Ohtaekwangia sp.]
MSLTVIITDDDPVAVYIQRTLLQRSKIGSTPLTFLKGRETLAYFDLHYKRGETYLILMDINMPDITGWELLDILKQRNYDGIHVAVVSSSIDNADLEKSKNYDQVVGYFEKPIDLSGLVKIKAIEGLHKFFAR